jgi:hypothetical protein
LINAALIAVISKDVRRELATGIAIDTGGIDKKVSRNVFGQSLLQVRHAIKLVVCMME